MSWKLHCAFDVYGEPKGQPRPRAFVRGKRAAVYDPGTAEGWKGMIALAAKDHLPASPLEGPVRLGLTFCFPRPARLMRQRDPEGPVLHLAKPDFDNASKAVADCLTQIGMWRDDQQVCSWIGEKYYTGKHQAAGALIQIFVWEES